MKNTATHAQQWKPADTRGVRFMLVRTSLGMTQRDIGARVGLTARQVQSLEDDHIGVRDIDAKVKRYSLALGIDRDWLMWGGPLAGGDDPDRDPTRNRVNKLYPDDVVCFPTSPRVLVAA